MVLSAAPAEEQDPELVQWIKQKPTVLINLGSAFTYSISQSKEMADGIRLVLESNPDLQILWKYKLSPNVVDFDWQAVVAPLESTQRVRATPWLSVDPSALMETGYITAFVTHGGSGGYHESISAGVPQIVLPLWADLYNYAQLAEQIGVGYWACRETSPDWTPGCLRDEILRAAAGPQSEALKLKAKEISVEARKDGLGRDISAGIVAGLARSGH